MDINEFLTFEVTGITNTILEYTRNHYIVAYANLLVKSAAEENYDMIEGCIKRLLEWYECRIEEIRVDKHIYNKAQHEKGVQLLREALEQVKCKNK